MVLLLAHEVLHAGVVGYLVLEDVDFVNESVVFFPVLVYEAIDLLHLLLVFAGFGGGRVGLVSEVFRVPFEFGDLVPEKIVF